MAKRPKRPQRPPAAKPPLPAEARAERPELATGRRDDFILLVLTAAMLVPVWLVAYFPSQDGGSHLETASVLFHYGGDSVFRQYYDLNLKLGPNWVVTVLLGGLMLVTSPAVAEKIFVSGYVLLFAAGLRMALGAIRAESRWLAGLGLLLVYNFPLHMGFYNFCLSLALLMVVLGVFLSRHPRWTILSTLVMAGLSLLLYLCHPVSLVIGTAIIGVVAVWPWPERPWRKPRALLAPLLALLPALALLATFLTREGSDLSGGASRREMRFDDFYFLLSFDDAERKICLALFALFGACVLYRLVTWMRQPERARWASLAVATGVVFAIYALAPDKMAGGSLVKTRLTIYPFMALLLWLAAGSYARWFKIALQSAATVLLVVQLGTNAQRYRAVNRMLEVFYQSTPHLEPNSTLLPLDFDPWGTEKDGVLSIRVQPFLHAAGRMSAAREAMTLLNQPGNTDYYPVILKPSNNPYKFITPNEKNFQQGRPPEFITYPERTGGRVDFVLLWGLPPQLQNHPSVRRILEQLAMGYEEIDRSPDGKMRFFKHKKPET